MVRALAPLLRSREQLACKPPRDRIEARHQRGRQFDQAAVLAVEEVIHRFVGERPGSVPLQDVGEDGPSADAAEQLLQILKMR